MFDVRPTRPRVWIVDDSPLDAQRAERALSSRYEVRVFEDGGSVLEALANGEQDELPRVLVLDWLMPGVSGIDVCQYLRNLPDEHMASIAVLLLTVHQRSGQVAEGLAAGADDFLSKPYAQEELLARVGALVRGRELIERAERAEATLLHLLASSPDALVGVDAEGRIVYVNPEAERVLGRSSRRLEGARLPELLPELAWDWSRAKSGLPRRQGDIEIGGRTYSPLIRGTKPDGRGAYVVTLRDVTLERETAQRRLDLYAIIAHDLRTPLSAAVLRIEALLRSPLNPPAPTFAEALGKLQRNLRELVGMVNDFLEIARFEGGMYVMSDDRVSLRQIAEDAVDEFLPLADSRKLRLGLGEQKACEGYVRGDPRRLKLALSNLLGNAIKFTPEGGRVEVRVLETGDRVVVEVEDTGRGIAPERLPHVFQRYSRAVDREHEVIGSGLGLMIVRETVRAHGGDVGATSVEGQGSTFSFWLPAVEPLPSA